MTATARLDEVDTVQRLEERIDRILAEARRLGASAAEVGVSEEVGLSVNVRQREVETVEFNRDKGFGITVYFGHCKGSASTSDSSDQAIVETVAAACNIAKYTSADEYNGLADADLMATEFPDLQLNHPWTLSPEAGQELALRCEAAALADPRLTNSDGAQVSSHQGIRLYGNSHGFVGQQIGTRHSLSCVVVAGAGGAMQRDYYYTSERDAAKLLSAEFVGEEAARRTVARLDPQRLTTGTMPVLFAPEQASGLIGHLLGAISGGAQYRRASFLLECIDEQVFPEHITIREHPRLPGLMGSANFDGDGVATREQSFVQDGMLVSYLLGTYSARRLGLPTTGNTGGAHNVFVSHSDLDQAGLLREMGNGLLVTDLMGQGVNGVTGDYSRGAAGFIVEGGQIKAPVDNITVAGNLRDMYMRLVAVGNDIDHRGNVHVGSILIDGMTVAG